MMSILMAILTVSSTHEMESNLILLIFESKLRVSITLETSQQ